MQCPRCLNTDESFFYKGTNGWYCRRCISFGRMMLEEEKEPVSLSPVKEGSEEYTLRYPLTKAQAEIAVKCAELIDTSDVLLHCVCGAGKTELVVLSIANMLKRGRKVCFAIPRRQVVLELRERLAQYFPNAKVIAVCGGHTQETDGDLIICTTHQLYRYYRAFDLLILDEPDAFPFRGSEVLHGIADTCRKGHCIYLTATPDETMRKTVREGKMKELVLHQRPHGRPVPVPEILTAPALILLIRMFRWIREFSDKPRMVFMPSVRGAERMASFMRLFFPVYVCTGRSEDRDEVIEAFRREKSGLMICTTVLERGVTVENVQVCVFQADSSVFDEASLTQMAGRAGRTFREPEGNVLFLCTERSAHAESCRDHIRTANAGA